MLGHAKEKFTKIIYFKGAAGLGDASGNCYSNAKAIADGDIMPIPANVIIENVYVIIDTAITGTTVAEIGDDDDADGFVKDFAADFATPGMYGYSAKTYCGDYLKVQTAGGTDAADIDIVPSAKYYAATGKEMKLNVTTANTAGAFRVVVEGFYVGAAS